MIPTKPSAARVKPSTADQASTPASGFSETLDRTSSHFKIMCDIKETPTSFEITADLPGVKKDKVKVTIHERLVTISAERRRDDASEGEKYARTERFNGTITRSMLLPDTADEENVQATFDDGVLVLKIAKSPEKALPSPKFVDIQ